MTPRRSSIGSVWNLKGIGDLWPSGLPKSSRAATWTNGAGCHQSVTRARYPPRFEADNKWLNGPSVLTLPEEEWPSQPDDINGHVCREETRPKFLLRIGAVSNPMLDISRISKFSKMKRTAAWVLRFVRLLRRGSDEPGELSAKEVDEGERLLCLQAQVDVFTREINLVRQNMAVEKSRSIFKLKPYIGDDGLLRVHGRIDAATTTPFASRRPVIMPKHHPITKSLIHHYHRLLHHQNDDVITNEVRLRFWVPHLRSAVRKVKTECSRCRR